MVGVDTILNGIREDTRTNQLTLTTGTIPANSSTDIEIDQNDIKVDDLSFAPENTELPNAALIISTRIIVDSGSTDSDLKLYEGSSRDNIDEALRINELSSSDDVQTFVFNNRSGILFKNSDNENRWHLTIDENSGSDSVYTIRFNWVDLDIA